SIDMIPIVITELKELGCEFELGFKKVLAVNIPDEVNYNPIKNYLDKGENKGTWEYDEGCIAANHSHII
ncbi:MAG: DUF4265 domain-containing protein, partial [Saprospiraceae bacterium]